MNDVPKEFKVTEMELAGQTTSIERLLGDNGGCVGERSALNTPFSWRERGHQL